MRGNEDFPKALNRITKSLFVLLAPLIEVTSCRAAFENGLNSNRVSRRTPGRRKYPRENCKSTAASDPSDTDAGTQRNGTENDSTVETIDSGTLLKYREYFLPPTSAKVIREKIGGLERWPTSPHRMRLH